MTGKTWTIWRDGNNERVLALGTDQPEGTISLAETFLADTWEEAFKHYRNYKEWENCFEIGMF